jgi:predicted DCC family thiol-disulfide oxidoreductase YuxK
MGDKKILIYDASCITCRVMKNVADIAVSNYEFVDASSTRGRELSLERDLDTESSAYVLDGNRTIEKSDMALEVIRDVRGIGPLLSAIMRLLPHAWRDRAYEWLVRHRIK